MVVRTTKTRANFVLEKWAKPISYRRLNSESKFVLIEIDFVYTSYE